MGILITALFTKLKTWKQLKYPSTDALINKMWSMEYYFEI